MCREERQTGTKKTNVCNLTHMRNGSFLKKSLQINIKKACELGMN